MVRERNVKILSIGDRNMTAILATHMFNFSQNQGLG